MSASYTMLLRAEAYLAERRRLGLALNRPGSQIIGFRAFCGRGRSQGALDVRHCSPMGEGRSAGRTPLHMGQKGRRSSPVRTLSHRSRSTHRVSNRCSFRSFKTPARTAYLYTSGSRGVDRRSEPSLATRRIDAGNLRDALWFAGRYGPADIRSTEPTLWRHRRHAGAPHSPTLKVPADSARSPALDHDPGVATLSAHTRQIWFNGYHHAALHVREDRGGASV
jgi:hypothetical protein